MRLKDFFLNCLNRRSFQFLSIVSFLQILILFFILSICIIKHIDSYAFLTVLMLFGMLILPTFGLVNLLSIITIYIKLLVREHKNPEYRIKNKFLTQNPIYRLFAFLFYIFAIVWITFLLINAIQILLIHWKTIFDYSFLAYPFLIYTLIHIFIILII